MIKATDLRIYNLVMVKTSNDSGIYQVEGICGWKRIFDSDEDEKIYNAPFDEKQKRQPIFHDERIVIITGGARDGEKVIESKLRPIKLTDEWFLKLGFTKKDGAFYIVDSYFNHIEFVKEIGTSQYQIQIENYIDARLDKFVPLNFVHELQNVWYDLTKTELQFP